MWNKASSLLKDVLVVCALAVAAVLGVALALALVSAPVAIPLLYGELEVSYAIAAVFAVLGLILIPRVTKKRWQGSAHSPDALNDFKEDLEHDAKDYTRIAYAGVFDGQLESLPHFEAKRARSQLKVSPFWTMYAAAQGVVGTYALGMAAGISATALTHTDIKVADVSASTIHSLSNGLLLNYPNVINPSSVSILPDTIAVRHADFFIETVGAGLLLLAWALSVLRFWRMRQLRAAVSNIHSPLRRSLETAARHAFADALKNLSNLGSLGRNGRELSASEAQMALNSFERSLWLELGSMGERQ